VLWLCAALVVTTLAVYGQMIGHGFISFDDRSYITQNPVVQKGLTFEGLVWAFSAPHVYNWHPLTWLSHMADVQLFGLHAGGHHLMSLLFHTANAVLLFLILWGMTGALWRSAAVAFLFALHPLHVESVAWASERKDVLSTLFWLLAIASYLYWVKRPAAGRYSLLLACYAVGLLTKQMAVTLPFVLLLLDYWPLGRLSPAVAAPPPPAAAQPEQVPGRKARRAAKTQPTPEAGNGGTDAVPAGIAWPRLGPLILEKIPLFALAAGASLMIYLVQTETGIVKSAADFPFPARLANAVFSYAAYLIKTVYPAHLAIFYPHPGTGLPLWQVAGAGALIVLATALIARAAKPWLTVGWLWYLGTLVPVIGLVQVGVQGMADRYTYVPLVGIFIMIAWGVPELASRWRSRKVILVSAATAGFALLTVLAWYQVRTWQNDFTLYSHAVRVVPGNYWAEYNLGLTLAAEGQLDEALSHFAQAIRYQPDYADAYLNIGTIQARRGRLAEAAASFSRVLDLSPSHEEANRNMILLLLQQGKPAEAFSRLEALLKARPDKPESWFVAGLVQARSGNPGEAESAYGRALRLKPSYAEAHNNLGILLARQGRLAEAIDHFREALRIRPDYREAARNLETAMGEIR